MATITKLPSGKHCVRIRRQGHKLITKTFIQKADALRWARTVESEMDRGLFVDRTEAESTTLSQALERYKREVTPAKKGAVRETARIDCWIRSDLAGRSLASLKGSDFATYRDKRLKAGMASNTVRLELALVSHLFKVAAMEWGIGVSNPVAAIRKPGGSNARTRRLEGDEEKRLLAACRESKNHHLFPLVVLALETAMRLGEMLSCTWDEVDLPGRSLEKGTAKNGNGRVIPLTKKAVEILSGIPCSPTTRRVFHHFPPHSDSIKNSWNTAKQTAGISGLRFHDLRHEAISRLTEAGLNPLEAAAISGHKTLNMLKRYTHLKPADLLRKMEQATAKG